MSGSGKGVSGVVGISRNGSGAGTFPDSHQVSQIQVSKPDTLDEAPPSSSLQSGDLGQARQACNLDEEMKIFQF